MDHLCGRLVYYDEVTTDFGSADSDRIEVCTRARPSRNVFSNPLVVCAVSQNEFRLRI